MNSCFNKSYKKQEFLEEIERLVSAEVGNSDAEKK